MKIFERNNPFISVIFLTIVVLCDCAMPKPDSTDPEEWAYYNHDPQNSKFSALDKIDTGNVVQLKKKYGSLKIPLSMGLVYFSTPLSCGVR